MDELGHHDALALLEWQIELGADEAILDTPMDRFALDDAPPAPAPAPAPVAARAAPTAPAQPATAAPATTVNPTELARHAAAGAADLPALKAAMEGFGLCPLSQTATQLVFADGTPAARVMIVGEAPRRDEDIAGRPFVGQDGRLLDRMLAAIGLDRTATDPASAVYITNMLPWRPPQDRDPSPEELSMLVPFLRRHIELAGPDILVLMGNHACHGLTGRTGITRLRGQWTEVMGRPAIPMFPPDHLLRKPHEKAKAWEDLLSLKARLRMI